MLINIGKAKYNYDKDGRSKYFNCNKYGHMAKNVKRRKRTIQESILNMNKLDILQKITKRNS